MKKHLRTDNIDSQSRIFLAANIIVIYSLTVFAVIFALEHFGVALYRDQTPVWATPVMLLVWVLYYVIPVFLAMIYGFLFRPFWRGFRNLWLAIFFVQMLYSFTAAMVRWEYVQKFQKRNSWHKSDRLTLVDFESKWYDRDEDGFIDEIIVSPKLDLSLLRRGEYLLDAVIDPGGAFAPFSIDGGGTFSVTDKARVDAIAKQFSIKLKDEFGRDYHLFEEKNFQVKLLLFRVVTIDHKGKAILRYTRWAPFLRQTDWVGKDPDVYENMLLLDRIQAKEVFIMLAPRS